MLFVIVHKFWSVNVINENRVEKEEYNCEFGYCERILQRHGNIVVLCAGHFDIIIIRTNDLRVSTEWHRVLGVLKIAVSNNVMF